MVKRLKSGHILRIPLWCGWGFAYAKYINVAGIHGNDSYRDLLKIFDFRSPAAEPLEIGALHTYLMQPVLMAGRLPTLRQQIWQIVGELPLLPEDAELPDMRVPEEDVVNRMIISQPPKPGATLYTKNLDLRPQFETAIQNVEHLEFLTARGSGLIEISATMTFMKQAGVNVADYFDLTDPRYSYEYELIKNRPLANTLPKHLYGRARLGGDAGFVAMR